MKDAKKEMHGQELNTDFGKKKKYQDYFEPVPFRPTFSDKDHQVSSSGARLPERHWGDIAPMDPKTGQPVSTPTPVSGQRYAEPKKFKHSAAVTYSKGKQLSEAHGPVVDAGEKKEWIAGPRPGSVGPANTGGELVQKHTGKDPILSWKNRDYAEDDKAYALAPAKRHPKK